MRVASLLALASARRPWPRPAAAAPAATDPPVASYHADAARSGRYVVAGLTWAAAATMHRDRAFDGRVPGHIYAQPLYWHVRPVPRAEC